jgi:hypothetical protein
MFIIDFILQLLPIRFSRLRYLPFYISQYFKFKRLGGIVFKRHMILNDYFQQAGTAKGHYFHQDLLVASFIFQSKPERHIDVGSRIDGFVAHVASFRRIEVMDVRVLKSTGHANITFLVADLMSNIELGCNVTDSISCLHAIEHFGLGRYGDPIDPLGHVKGFNNIVKMLKVGGILYISFPIGRSTVVHFNAHRVFHPKEVFTWANDSTCLQLERFDFVDDDGELHTNVNLNTDSPDVDLGCGIYTFKRIH